MALGIRMPVRETAQNEDFIPGNWRLERASSLMAAALMENFVK